jgi:hypothetical protein
MPCGHKLSAYIETALMVSDFSFVLQNLCHMSHSYGPNDPSDKLQMCVCKWFLVLGNLNKGVGLILVYKIEKMVYSLVIQIIFCHPLI